MKKQGIQVTILFVFILFLSMSSMIDAKDPKTSQTPNTIKQLEQIGKALQADKAYMAAWNRIDRKEMEKARKLMISVFPYLQNSRDPKYKESLAQYRNAVVSVYKQIDDSGLTAELLRIGPVLLKDFNLSRASGIMANKCKLCDELKISPSAIHRRFSAAERNKTEVFSIIHSRQYDENLQMAEEVIVDDGPGMGGGVGDGFGAVCTVNEYFSAVFPNPVSAGISLACLIADIIDFIKSLF